MARGWGCGNVNHVSVRTNSIRNGSNAMRDDRWLPLARPTPRHREPFLWLLSLLLLIYATLGRSGAYLGLPVGGGSKIFIGELVLFFGLASSLLEGSWQSFFALPLAWVWLLFAIWNAAQTLPYYSQYGMDALRDGATWGYSLFSVVIGSLVIARPAGLMILLDRYRKFARVYIFFVLIVMPASILFPTVSGFELPLVEPLMEHVTGATAFALCRLVSVPAAWWWALGIEVIIIGTQGRGVALGFLAAVGVVWLLNPWAIRPRPSIRTIGLGGALVFFLAASMMSNLNFGVSATGRVLGPNQYLQNLEGAFYDTGNEKLDGTRAWREEMWEKIIDYTIFGPYFWTGKGYGINILADAGMSMGNDKARPARHPENSHLTFLARSGVPGFVLWVTLQATWALGLLRGLLFARRTGRRRTVGLMTFLLACWTDINVVASTGPVIESPNGGIWFWTIFGIGAAVAYMVRRDPDFFERLEFRPAVAASGRRAA